MSYVSQAQVNPTQTITYAGREKNEQKNLKANKSSKNDENKECFLLVYIRLPVLIKYETENGFLKIN